MHVDLMLPPAGTTYAATTAGQLFLTPLPRYLSRFSACCDLELSFGPLGELTLAATDRYQ